MKKFLCVGESYEKNGEKKVHWNRIGEMFESKNGKMYAKLYAMPGTLISVFDDQKKETPKVDEFGADMETPF